MDGVQMNATDLCIRYIREFLICLPKKTDRGRLVTQ